MTVRSVIQIDLEGDEKFKAFSELFSKYEEALKKTPGAWAAASKEARQARSTFEQIAAALLAQNELTRKTAKAEREGADQAHKAAESWHRIARSSGQFVSNVASATRNILKWVGVGTAFGGLVGAGGLFGLDRLAGGVTSARRSAMGYGASYGGTQGIQAELGWLINPSALLGGVANALTGPERYRLSNLGIGENDIRGKTTDQVALLVLQRLKGLADKTPQQLLGYLPQQYGTEAFGADANTFLALKSLPAKELALYEKRAARDRKTLNLTLQQQQAWTELTVTLKRAGATIETILGRHLVGLAGPLEQLSERVIDSISAFAKNGGLDKLVSDVGSGILWLDQTLGSSNFKQNFKTIEMQFSHFASWLGDLDFQHGVTGFIASAQGKPDISLKSAGLGYTSPFAQMGNAWHWFKGIWNGPDLPKGLLQNVYGAESGYGKYLHSKAGAIGPFQLMPDTARRYGLTTDQAMMYGPSEGAAGSELKRLIHAFGGDIAEAVAAYNWGQGNVQHDIAKYGAHWRDHLPRETRDYLTKVLTGQGLKYGVNIKVQNESGANVVVSTNQVAK